MNPIEVNGDGDHSPTILSTPPESGTTSSSTPPNNPSPAPPSESPQPQTQTSASPTPPPAAEPQLLERYEDEDLGDLGDLGDESKSDYDFEQFGTSSDDSGAQEEKVPKNLRCEICRKMYNKPRVLECLHRFCEECVQEQLETMDKVTAMQYGGKETMYLLVCPICKQVS